MRGIFLVNGATTERVKNSESFRLDPCGCGYTITNDIATYAQMCTLHYEHWRNLHDAARTAHLATLKT